jgi:hypothetical protein
MDEVSWKKKLALKYPLRLGRYLTQEEREDIRRLVPDTGPDLSDWKRKLENGEIFAAIRRIFYNDTQKTQEVSNE